ncbi:hypothetical protein IE81DRAFT_324256 [Ceraceosorus guamensis]|uniref:Amino acid transporter transmembrane domain-containing protein n=1 Tax=Ceraceosorus guamensis TaxID=1522189 RepID=A0A316VWE0_9BASI|nr:hypothetical protein IE81DRAFT_324256 [Ceraceosorus guamensis]PWN41759.1 hypothetical protein IE81DRAFT_324256 [Ceraceosorus guamensis]
MGRLRIVGKIFPAGAPKVVDRAAAEDSTPSSPGAQVDGTVVERKASSDVDPEKGEPKDVHAVVRVVSNAQESGEIQYRTMSWQRCACLLFTEYVCLAILSFPWAFRYLGMAGGILSTLGLGIIALYTSMTLWRYCMKNPHLLHIADIGQDLFGKHWLAYELTGAALILNNCFIMGLHTLTGSEVLNVLSDHGTCTLVFSIVVLIVCFLGTLPRKLDQVAILGVVSAICMFISIVLVIVFTGIIGKNPAGLKPDEPVRITAWAPEGTTFVEGFNAFLNILFTWVGQIMYPSFISEMKNPNDFPKALYATTAMEFFLFLFVGIYVYAFAGQYAETPAVAILPKLYKQISFSFVLVTSIIIGCLYGSVVAKYLFNRITLGTKHYNNNTVKGWIIWIACCASTWVFGWIIGEAVPFFGVLVSLMSALFDGFFGFIFWGKAYLSMNKGQLWKGQSILRKAETIFNVFLIFAGLFVFGPGCYTSVQAIIDSYALGSVKSPFSCANNAV